MSEPLIGVLMLLGSIIAIQSGIQIGIALIVTAIMAGWALRGIETVGQLVASSATTAIASETFAVIPLFVMMGLLVSVTRLGPNLFDVAAYVTRGLRGGLGIATVLANTVFAACTGTSIASASVFTKVAVPELLNRGYTKEFSVGVVAGSSILGMLIPPSLLMIIFGILSNTSIGQLFKAGVLPGIVMCLAFCTVIVMLSIFRPSFVFDKTRVIKSDEPVRDFGPLEAIKKFFPVAFLVGLVLGGLYGGLFTPSEAGGAGALATLAIGLIRRELSLRILWNVVIETGRVTASLAFVLIAAQIYSQVLTMSGLPFTFGQMMAGSHLSFWGLMSVYLFTLVIMGCFLDSLSVMLIALPFFLPVISAMGADLVWVGLLTIIAVEIGLLTPPFGMAVFVVKSNLTGHDITLGQIFKGSMPFYITMVVVLILCAAFPSLVLLLT